MDDPCTFPLTFDLAPFMAPNRKDFKVVQTPQGPRAPYMDWAGPDNPPTPAPLPYKLYGEFRNPCVYMPPSTDNKPLRTRRQE